MIHNISKKVIVPNKIKLSQPRWNWLVKRIKINKESTLSKKISLIWTTSTFKSARLLYMEYHQKKTTVNKFQPKVAHLLDAEIMDVMWLMTTSFLLPTSFDGCKLVWKPIVSNCNIRSIKVKSFSLWFTAMNKGCSKNDAQISLAEEINL